MSFRLKSGFTYGGWLEQILAPENKEQSFIISNLQKNSDNYFLFHAFLESMKQASYANPNPSVGCLIVKNNTIISKGCTEKWGERHAERVAFQQLSADQLKDSTVYVTLEPCTHHGRQPPCLELFINSGIQKVIIGCQDPNPLVSGKGIAALVNAGIGVLNPKFANEISAWNYPFFIQQKQQKIFIALKWAQTLDGCLADDLNGWKWISGEKSRKYTHWLRQKYDAILVGIGTVLNDFPSLDVRHLNISQVRHPIKMIYDPEGKIFEASPLQQKKLHAKTLSGQQKTIFFVTAKKLNSFSKKQTPWIKHLLNNSKIIFCPLQSKLPVYENIILALSQINFINEFGRPLQSIFVEGGPRLLSAFLNENKFDLIHLFIAPFFLGGEKNRLFSKVTRAILPTPMKRITKEPRYFLSAKEYLDEDLLLEIIQK